MKNQRFLSALAATVMAVSLFTCTALAANEPADAADRSRYCGHGHRVREGRISQVQ